MIPVFSTNLSFVRTIPPVFSVFSFFFFRSFRPIVNLRYRHWNRRWKKQIGASTSRNLSFISEMLQVSSLTDSCDRVQNKAADHVSISAFSFPVLTFKSKNGVSLLLSLWKFYKNDAFGLKTLDERGDVLVCVQSGVKHSVWRTDPTVFRNCMEQWLTWCSQYKALLQGVNKPVWQLMTLNDHSIWPFSVLFGLCLLLPLSLATITRGVYRHLLAKLRKHFLIRQMCQGRAGHKPRMQGFQKNSFIARLKSPRQRNQSRLWKLFLTHFFCCFSRRKSAQDETFSLLKWKKKNILLIFF